MTEIQLYNTRTRAKERFEPLILGQVRMYVCGPTVYDRAHIGNARPVVVFDVLYRLLRHVYGPDAVTYVRNFTDVDDKIIARAQETKREGETLEAACRRITDETIRWYHEDMGALPDVPGALGALKPTHEPRATDFIEEMKSMIERLIAKDCAYEREGHVLFDVTKYNEMPGCPAYGRLSRRSLEDMQAGARVEVAPYKKNPMDFVLWKPSTPEQPGWESPWGRGRPGWHIECSAMSQALLGQTFDIHGGGIDLLFPHHENEAAQSCCANHTEVMANFWLHNGFLQVEGEKMAKSLGNFFTVRDLLDKGVPGEVVRFVMLSTKYSEPLDWTKERVEEATRNLNYLYRKIGNVSADGGSIESRALDALCNDLNTSEAIHWLLNEAGYADRGLGDWTARDVKATGNILGLLHKTADEWFRGDFELVEMIESLLHTRGSARWAKDYAKADAIRDGLTAAGVKLSDAPDGTNWELENLPSMAHASARANRAAAEEDDLEADFWQSQFIAMQRGDLKSKEGRLNAVKELYRKYCE